jgi:hypothetical protein
MSLDKFGIGGTPPKKTSKKTSKKATTSKKAVEDDDAVDFDDLNVNMESDDEDSPISSPTPSSGGSSKRKALKCTDVKCGYKRVLFKSILADEDLICQKCGKSMKLVK